MEEQRATNPTEEKTCSINDLSYGSDTWIYLKSVQNMTNVLNDGATEECCASHGRNMSPMRRCSTRSTQRSPSLMDATGFPWSPSKERWHHTRSDDWATTWNQTQRNTKNYLAEGPRFTSKHQLQRGSNHTERYEEVEECRQP